MTQSNPSIKDFESAIAELEKIVKQLEDGDLALDKALALFERGIELSRYCHDQLGAAQRRIEVLSDRGQLRDASPRAAGDHARERCVRVGRFARRLPGCAQGRRRGRARRPPRIE
jgi:exodeoxyribonuclease VII small subunit